MKLLKLYAVLLLVALVSQVGLAQESGKVFTAGAMNEMGRTNFKPQVWLDTLPDKSHLFGMGPYDRMKGEIMVFDGKPFYASAFEEGRALVSQSWDIRSPFFVYSNVLQWEAFELSGDINTLDDIQNKVAAIAKKNGYNTEEPFPFQIIGSFDTLTTHIVTPRSPDVEGYRADVKQQVFSFNHGIGSLLGFYSEKHQGIFTSSRSYIHVHYLSDDQTFMGHLDKINTAVNTLTLYLPAKPKSYKTGLRVNDTDFSKGRLGNIQKLELKDLAKFHGHLCDGLVVGYLALQQALLKLYPDGIIDRTNTRIISKPSPCLTDAAIYLTGARYQYNSFYVSEDINGLFTVQRMDNGKTVVVQMNKGVKPEAIDFLGAKAIKGELSPCELDELKAMEDNFTEQLLQTDPKSNFTVSDLTDFQWEPILKNDFSKTDILNKDTQKCSR
ncbi:MAG: FmdE family protein [Muriicola sp.]